MRHQDPDKRVERITVRFSPRELAQIKHNCEQLLGIPPSEYIRRRVFDRKLVVKRTRQWHPSVVLQIKAIGTNLNQIARALNSRKHVEPERLKAILDAIEESVLKAMDD